MASLIGCVPLVFEVVYILLPSSMADLVPYDRLMQKAYERDGETLEGTEHQELVQYNSKNIHRAFIVFIG